MSLMTFANYNKSSRPKETTVLAEAFSMAQTRTAVIGMATRMSQLHQRVEQDRTADSAQRFIADMLFVLASMLTLAIGAIGSDPELINHARSSVSR